MTVVSAENGLVPMRHLPKGFRIAWHDNSGISLLEILVIVVVIAIVAVVAVPSFQKFYRIHTFKRYAASVDSLVRLARLTAMQNSVNVGVCVQANSSLQIINMGANRSNYCSGTLMSSLAIQDSFVSLQGSGSAFDPRGFAISTGSVCVADGSKFHTVTMGTFGTISSTDGSGGCS